MATRLPACLKFDGSQLGGCKVDCKGVCVELPLANIKGPVETNGQACNLIDNGTGGDGDSDGSGNTPDEGNSGTKPIAGWLDFEPVIGDATGTSVSGAVAKLNKNLGVAMRHLVEKNGSDSANLNSISHAAQSVSRDMNTALYHLERTANEAFYSKGALMEIMGRMNTSNDYLQSINTKMDKFGSSPSGGSSTGGGESSSDVSAIRNDVASLKGMTQSYMSTIGSMSGDTRSMSSNLSRMSGDIGSMKSSLSSLNSVTSSQLGSISGNLSALVSMNSQALRSGWGPSGGSSGDGTVGSGIDYSQMPGSSSNPLFVGEASYQSQKCLDGAGCFFDLPTINKKLKETNNALTNQYRAISEDVKQVFSFNLTGSADPMECLDLFTHQGKEYTVCPPSGDYWKTLAALMMFIFYFVALMIIFKR
ncbi:hypothetical protein [Aeromonas allosaccharophila]